MSNNKDDAFNPFDPTVLLKELRDVNLDAWAKSMVSLVNTDAYAEATGRMLDTWLSSSGPFRKILEDSMTRTLAELNLPSRRDVTRIAERLTNIELRLDDLEVEIEDALPKKSRPSKAKKEKKES